MRSTHEDEDREGDDEKMLTKNTRTSVATVAVALITGAMMALLLALMPAPAKAQSGDVLRLLSIKCVDITNDEGGIFGDFVDEPYIKVDGAQVWSGQMRNGDIVNLAGVSATLSGASADVQLWERDPGAFNQPDDFLGEFSAEYTGGDERAQTINFRNGEAVYQIKYVVDRPPSENNTAPTIDSVKPTGKIRDRTPLIGAVVRDAETDLSQGNITLKVDGSSKSFSYDAGADRLSHQSRRLSYGRHTVTVEARDAGGLETSKTWSFKVVKKR